jgi:hypothetical protein
MRLGLIHQPHPALPALERHIALAAATSGAVNWHAHITLDGDALGNDAHGDCVECGVLRSIQIMRAVTAGDQRKPEATQALELYAAWAGFPAQDNGTVSSVAAAAWATKGVAWGDQYEDVPIIGTVPLSSVRTAIATLGPVQLDINMPDSAVGADVWDAGSAPGSWGAHRVCAARCDSDSVWCVSWGREFRMTQAFLDRYVLGVEACVSRSWLDARGISPSAETWDALKAEMARL